MRSGGDSGARRPRLPLSHRPAGKSSGCFPMAPEIKPASLSDPRAAPLPLPHPPTPASLSPLTPQQGGLPLLSNPARTSLERPSPTPYSASWLYGTCHYLELLILFYFVLVCLPPPNRSSRKPGNLAQLDLAASSKPTEQVLQIIKAK